MAPQLSPEGVRAASATLGPAGTGAAMAPVVGAVEVVPEPGHHPGQAETAGGVS